MKFLRKSVDIAVTLSRSQELEKDLDRPKVSFCITHKDRLEFLKKTLPKNLNDLLGGLLKSEIVLVDFSHDDHTIEWVLKNHINHIVNGQLKFFHTKELKSWSSSIAKNTVHLLANGHILANLDCDNFIGPRGDQYIYDHFIKDENDILLWQYSGIKRDGSFGRMSLRKEIFDQLGGYNEQFLAMGYQDNDLKHRATRIGLKLIHDKNTTYNQAIKHKKYSPDGMSFRKMNSLNEKLSKQRIRANILVANNGSFGIRKNLNKMNEKGILMPYHVIQ